MPDNAEREAPKKDIHALFEEVRAHPDFVFGTIFVTADFPRGEVPEHFYNHQSSDRLCEIGNEMIGDECGWEDDEEDEDPSEMQHNDGTETR